MKLGLRVMPVVVLLLLFDVRGLGSQQEASGTIRRIPAIVAIAASQFASGEMFLIKRSPPKSPGDVIVLSPDASADDLSTAIHALLQVRKLKGDTSVGSFTLRLRPGQLNGRSLGKIGWTVRVVRDLQRVEPMFLAGVGVVRSLTIWLPPQQASTRQ